MFASTKGLMDEIRMGESSFLECSEVRFSGTRVSGPREPALADGLAAFANSRGGVFVLGVEDGTRDVVGIPVERLDAVVDFVKEVCASSIDPPLEDRALLRLLLPTADGHEAAVIKVEVPRSLFVHRSPGGFLHRVADSKRVMSPEHLARMFQQRSQTRLIRFDEQVVDGATLEDLAPALWERFRTPRSDDDRDTFLRKLGMAGSGEEGTLRPTVSGVLMASEEPRRWLPNAYVQAVAYRGDEIRTGAESIARSTTWLRCSRPSRMPSPIAITPCTGPRCDCDCSRLDWRSIPPAPSPTRSPSTASAIGNLRAMRRCAACWRSVRFPTSPGSSPLARTSWTTAVKACR